MECCALLREVRTSHSVHRVHVLLLRNVPIPRLGLLRGLRPRERYQRTDRRGRFGWHSACSCYVARGLDRGGKLLLLLRPLQDIPLLGVRPREGARKVRAERRIRRPPDIITTRLASITKVNVIHRPNKGRRRPRGEWTEASNRAARYHKRVEKLW